MSYSSLFYLPNIPLGRTRLAGMISVERGYGTYFLITYVNMCVLAQNLVGKAVSG